MSKFVDDVSLGTRCPFVSKKAVSEDYELVRTEKRDYKLPKREGSKCGYPGGSVCLSVEKREYQWRNFRRKVVRGPRYLEKTTEMKEAKKKKERGGKH